MGTQGTENRRYLNLEGMKYDGFPAYFRAKNTTLAMMEARGYIVTEEEKKFIPMELNNCDTGTSYFNAYEDYETKLEQFVKYYQDKQRANKLSFGVNISKCYAHRVDGHTRYVIFVDSASGKNSTSNNVKLSYQTLIESEGGMRNVVNVKVTFVLPVGISLTELAMLNSAGLDYEIFTHNQLMVIPTEHTFSSTYRRLTREEATSLYNKEGMKPRDLPVFASNDPVVKFYGWVPGDLILIGRMNSSTEGAITVSTYYRLVSHATLPPLK